MAEDKKPAITRAKLCGTMDGVRAHASAGEYQCEPCKDARKTYMRDYRANRQPDSSKSRDKRRDTARGRARNTLISRHREEYELLVKEEMERSDR